MKTEARIKRLITYLHKALMQRYKEHPEGITDGNSLTYYGSLTLGIIAEDHTAVARLTVEKGDGHYDDIKSPIHGKKVSL